MATMELHRGRLIDHVQLVVRDLAGSRRFYDAVFDALGVPLGGEAKDFFWFDELAVSTVDAQRHLQADVPDRRDIRQSGAKVLIRTKQTENEACHEEDSSACGHAQRG